MFTYEDFYRNRIHSFSLSDPHKELVIKSHSIVVTRDSERSKVQRYELDKELHILQSEKLENDYAEYLTNTDYTYVTPEIKMYAEEVKGSNTKSVYEQLENISAAIYSHFKYDPEATNVHTTVSNTLKMKRGVCQDFTHLMIAMCKSLNIPARYVSGYHFIGDLQGRHADFEQASHAWVEAYVPGVGWLDFHPTNNGKIDWRYVKLGHGRDYSDMFQSKGFIRVQENKKLEILVDVKLVEE